MRDVEQLLTYLRKSGLTIQEALELLPLESFKFDVREHYVREIQTIKNLTEEQVLTYNFLRAFNYVPSSDIQIKQALASLIKHWEDKGEDIKLKLKDLYDKTEPFGLKLIKEILNGN